MGLYKGQKNENKSGAWYSVLWNRVKKTTAKVIRFLVEAIGKLRKDAKSLLYLSSAVGIALLITVIVLAVRLSGVSKELESVQAMSLSLQEELATAKAEQKTDELQLFSQNNQTAGDRAVPTVTPKPTATSAPTPTPVVEKYVVCIDAGHGDWDGGAVFKDAYGRELRAEKDDNLRMAKLFREALEAYPIEVVMTRESDVYLGLKERTAVANAANADALISFHRNSFAGEGDVRGVEFWIHSSQPQGAKMLAESMLDAVMEVGGMPNRGVKYGSMSSLKEDYEINRSANMTSMIVEFGFITSAADNEVYDTYGKAYTEKMAEAVYEWLKAQDAVGNE